MYLQDIILRLAFINKKSRTYLLLLVVFFNLTQLSAQVKEGQIIYLHTVNLHKRLKPEDEKMKEMIPEFKTQKMHLFYTKSESFYKDYEDEEDDLQATNAGGGGMGMRFMRPKSELYRNYKTKRKVESKEFMGEKFRIEDTLTSPQWKLTNESKKVLQYTCQKATMTDSTAQKAVIAWFTTEIACGSGPEGYGSLPGMILDLSINGDENQYTAIEVRPNLPKNEVIKAPTSGKLIADKDFKKMVEAKVKEMGGRGRNRNN